MRRFSGVFSIVVLLIVTMVIVVASILPATSVASADTGREKQIREASAAWDEAFNSENLEELMELYADDAVSMAPGFPPDEGMEAIESVFTYIFENHNWRHKTTIVGLLISGNVAVERGEYTMSENGQVFEEGKHIVVRKKSGNAWKVVWEIWNFNE